MYCTGGFEDVAKLPNDWSWDKYHSHEEVVGFLTWIRDTHSHVATTASIGQRCAPNAPNVPLVQYKFERS